MESNLLLFALLMESHRSFYCRSMAEKQRRVRLRWPPRAPSRRRAPARKGLQAVPHGEHWVNGYRTPAIGRVTCPVLAARCWDDVHRMRTIFA